MNRTIFVPICMALLLVGVLSCQRPSNAWNGTWKLNVSKSSIPGPDFVITVDTMGEFRTDNGTYMDRFRCDGKEYPTSPGHTVACVKTSSLTMDTTSFANGEKSMVAHLELSPDQKTLTIQTTAVQPEAKSQKNVYVRTFGSTGFAGGWRNPTRLGSHPQLMVLALNEHYLRVTYPEKDEYADMSPDGTDSVVHKGEKTLNATIAIHPRGPAEFLTTKKSGGRIVSKGSLTLSADGRTVTEVYWRPEMPNEKAVLIYDRQ